MNIPSILLGILLFLIFLVPIFYVIFSNLSSEKKRLKTLASLCKAQQIEIPTFEVIGNTFIGADRNKNFLVTADRFKVQETFQVIPINELVSVVVKANRAKNKSLDIVELDLIGKSFNKAIVFYDEDDDTNMADSEACLNEVNRWERTIKQRLQTA